VATATAQADNDRGIRVLMTPEGVPVTLRLADRGARIGAVITDLVILVLILIALWLGALLGFIGLVELGLVTDRTVAAILFSAVLILSFLVRSFYFCWFEVRWRGVTPGKRILGIRVADRRGGRLTAGAVIARNIMREIELFMPLTVIFAAPADAIDGIYKLLLLVWVGIFAMMPLFNRDRLRVGDLVAGTWVIDAPKQSLLDEVTTDASPAATGIAEGAEAITFTDAQLAIYGVFELQTLERVLRARGRNADATRHDVAMRIARKIGYEGSAPRLQARQFLEAFYTAQRARLEAGLLMGQRKERKVDGRRPASGLPRSGADSGR
jgi:uncharacterized RDD family membrane protein YckC